MKKLRLVLKSSLIYILIIILVVLIISTLLSGISNEFKKDITGHNIAVLSNIRDVTDFELESINNMSELFSVNGHINSALNTESPRDVYNGIYGIWNALASTNYLKESSLREYYIYLYETDMVLKSDTGYGGIDQFYLEFAEEDRGLLKTVEKDLHFRHILPPVKYNFEGKYIEVIPYLQSLPYDALYNTKGIAIYLLDKERIDSFFETLRLGQEGWAGILDGNGEILTFYNQENPRKIEEFIAPQAEELSRSETFLITFDDGSILMGVSSTKSDLIYLSYTEESVLFDRTIQINSLILRYALVLLIVGVVLILASTYLQFRPVIDSIESFSDEKGKETANLFSIVRFVMQNNNTLQKQVDLQSRRIKDYVINRILMGYYNEKIDIEKPASDVGITLYFDYYSVAILDYADLLEQNHARSAMEISSLKLLVENYMDRSDSITCLFSEYHQNSLTMLLMGNETEADISQCVDGLLDFLDGTVNYPIAIAMGKTYDSLLDTHKSFDEANELLMKHKIVGSKGQSKILRNPSLEKSGAYAFSLQQQLRLYKTILSGKPEAVKRLLVDFEQNNLIDINLSKNMLIQLLNDLRSLVIKINDNYQDQGRLDDLYDKILHSPANEKLFFMCENYCISVSENIEKSRDEDKSIMKQNIREFIENHFTEYDMGVAKLADNFNMKESLFSQVFKKMFGENASSYIEKMRIEEACRLMKEGELTIDRISETIGYSYPQVFRRAFKRSYGKSPSEYQKSIDTPSE